MKTDLNESILGNCEVGDVRVDLPIWFGDPVKSKTRIMFLGLEPRDSDPIFNIEKIGKYVFGTPFGIEHWTPKNKYFNSFQDVVKNWDILSYFTDVVKEYVVKKSKGEGDKAARESFWPKANESENLNFLDQEIRYLNPDHIIGIGNDSYRFLEKKFRGKFKVSIVRHPNARQDKTTKQNSWDIAREQLSEILR